MTIFDQDTEELVSLGQITIFPEIVIRELALNLNRSSDSYIPQTECEAAAVSLVRGLERAGWLVCPPREATVSAPESAG